MPINLGILGREGRNLHKEWKAELSSHGKYSNKNKYFKNNNMDAWYKKEKDINARYRTLLKEMEKKKEAEEKALEVLRKEADKCAKEADKKMKEEQKIKRRLDKEKRQLDLNKRVPRRSTRLAKKRRTPRCSNGTHRNQTNGRCEDKNKPKTRKRCPNGTRKSKKTGSCIEK